MCAKQKLLLRVFILLRFYCIVLQSSLGVIGLSVCDISTSSSRANDVPYGEFAVSRASVVRVSALTTSRNLQFTVLRQLGTFGRVRCTISSVYNQVRENLSLNFSHPARVNTVQAEFNTISVTFLWFGLLQNSSLPFVTSPYMVNFEEGVTEEQVSLPINSAAFLASGRSAAVSITSVELLSDGGKSQCRLFVSVFKPCSTVCIHSHTCTP